MSMTPSRTGLLQSGLRWALFQTKGTRALFLMFFILPGLATAADSFALKDVAGEYYYGDGLGVNCSLSVTPDLGLVVQLLRAMTGSLSLLARHSEAS